MVKALGEIVKIVSGLEKKSKSSDCYYQHQILFFNSLTTYHFFYLLLYTPYIFYKSDFDHLTEYPVSGCFVFVSFCIFETMKKTKIEVNDSMMRAITQLSIDRTK